jgi:hypothetical protein
MSSNVFDNQRTTYCAVGERPVHAVAQPLWQQQQVEYCNVLQEHKGECDLFDDIEVEMVSDGNYHDHIRIRKLQNDDLFPYNTAAFVQWFEMKSTDPQTRESLVYLQKRVSLKKELVQAFGDVKRADVTPEFVDECLVAGWQSMLEGSHGASVLKAKGFVDLASLSRNGFIHTDLNFEQTKTKLMEESVVGSWLLRKSSIHGTLMKNAEIVVLAYVSQNTNPRNGSVITRPCQMRLLHVYGVGWFECSERYVYSSFKLFGARKTGTTNVGAAPDHTTLFDVLIQYQNEGNIQWNKVIKASQEGQEGPEPMNQLDELD